MICKYCNKSCRANVGRPKRSRCKDCNVSYYDWSHEGTFNEKDTVVNVHTEINGKDYFVQYRPYDKKLPCRIVCSGYDDDINFTFALNITPSNIEEKLKLYLTFL